MENKEMVMGIALEKFTWKIENFSKVSTKKLYSKAFKNGGYKWKIVLYPTGGNENHFSLYINIATPILVFPLKIYAYLRVALINKLQTKNSIVKETQQKFIGEYRSWSSPSFIPLNEFLDPSKGYLVNDTCIIEAQIATSKDVAFDILNNVKLKEPKRQGMALKANFQNGKLKNGAPPNGSEKGKQQIEWSDETERHSSTTGECSQMGKEVEDSDLTLSDTLDFEKLGIEEKNYFPLLKEACKYHPSLIRSQKERTHLFKVWAFISLGKVIHFLTKTKVRDMNEDAWNQQSILWEELKLSGFDLAWLKPHVHNALGVKAQVERTFAVKNLQNSVVAMEIKMFRMRGELTAIESEFEVARNALTEARNSNTEMNSDAVLGYSMY